MAMVLTPMRNPANHAAFLGELRQYAMRLHTREQAPREGKAAAPKPDKPVRIGDHGGPVWPACTGHACHGRSNRTLGHPCTLQWEPKLAGYMQFMAESKVVYDTFEELLAAGAQPYCERGWAGQTFWWPSPLCQGPLCCAGMWALCGCVLCLQDLWLRPLADNSKGVCR